jgi:hypothetical protein
VLNFQGFSFSGFNFQGSKRAKGGPNEWATLLAFVMVALLRRGGLGWLRPRIGCAWGYRAWGYCAWSYIDNPTAAPGPKLDVPCDEGKQCVITTTTYAVTWMEVGTALPDDDLTCIDKLSAEPLDTQPLCVGVAAVAG